MIAGMAPVIKRGLPRKGKQFGQGLEQLLSTAMNNNHLHQSSCSRRNRRLQGALKERALEA